MTPILIPAKNIYRKQYEKLIDNLIDLVQVKTVHYSSDAKKDVAYRSSIVQTFLPNSNKYDNQEYAIDEIGANIGVYNIAFAYAYIQPYVYSTTIKIYKDEIKKTILSLEDLNFDVICNVERGKVTARVVPQGGDERIENIVFTKDNESVETITEFSFSETASANASNTWASATATIDEIFSKTTFSVTEHEGYYSVILAFVCGTRRYNLQGASPLAQSLIVDLQGTYEYAVPQQVNISIDGVVKTVDFVEETQSFGELTSKNAFVIGENNELMQSASYHKYETGQGLVTTYLAEIYKELLEEYKNGKKKLTLLCDINDYYYYDATKPDKKGSIAISRNLTRLTFREYDEVIPMIKLANGDYVPIAKNEDGTPMVFVVLAIRVFYDGVVWQELTLQQK